MGDQRVQIERVQVYQRDRIKGSKYPNAAINCSGSPNSNYLYSCIMNEPVLGVIQSGRRMVQKALVGWIEWSDAWSDSESLYSGSQCSGGIKRMKPCMEWWFRAHHVWGFKRQKRIRGVQYPASQVLRVQLQSFCFKKTLGAAMSSASLLVFSVVFLLIQFDLIVNFA